jgi:hypothetical protein
LAHGLIRPSFVPDPPTQEMRTVLRTRKQFVREKTSHILRIQKTLEDANIKLDSVITDIMGLSGRKIIEALIAGESDPAKLARLADPRVKASQQTLRQALRGWVTVHHRFLLRLHLDQIDILDLAIAKIDQKAEAGIAPFRTAVEQVSSTPGVKTLAAMQILSEIGTDVSRFGSDANLISWARICPAATKAPVKNAAPRAFARDRSGSRPHWCKAPGRQCARKTPTLTPSSTASKRGAAPMWNSHPFPTENGRKRIVRKLRRNPKDWDVLIKGHHEGYISWEEFERNQRLIADNTNRRSRVRPPGAYRAWLNSQRRGVVGGPSPLRSLRPQAEGCLQRQGRPNATLRLPRDLR